MALSKYQCGFPSELRSRLPEVHVGTLKIIKILTKKEYAILKNIKYYLPPEGEHKSKYTEEQRLKMGTCFYSVFEGTLRGEFRYAERHVCLKRLTHTSKFFCAECREHIPRTSWQMHSDMVPIDTGNIEIPLWHKDYTRV